MPTLISNLTTFSSVARSGSLGLSWTAPSNAQTSNDSYASYAALPGSSGYSPWLQGVQLVDASSLPNDAQITELRVKKERKNSGAGGTITDSAVHLKDDTGILTAINKADGTTWPSSDGISTSTFSAADLTTLALTVADVKAATFGCVLSAQFEDPGFDGPGASVDRVWVEIDYSVPTTGGNQGRQMGIGIRIGI